MPNIDEPRTKLDYAPRPTPSPKRRGPSETQKRIATPVIVAGLALLLWGLVSSGPSRFDLWTAGAGISAAGFLLRFL